MAADQAEVDGFLSSQAGVAIAKTPRGGYDGKGVRVVSSGQDVPDWLSSGPRFDGTESGLHQRARAVGCPATRW